jgi:hypothetical protein
LLLRLWFRVRGLLLLVLRQWWSSALVVVLGVVLVLLGSAALGRLLGTSASPR